MSLLKKHLNLPESSASNDAFNAIINNNIELALLEKTSKPKVYNTANVVMKPETIFRYAKIRFVKDIQAGDFDSALLELSRYITIPSVEDNQPVSSSHPLNNSISANHAPTAIKYDKEKLYSFLRSRMPGRYIIDDIIKFCDYDFIKSLTAYGLDLNTLFDTSASIGHITIANIALKNEKYNLFEDIIINNQLTSENRINLAKTLILNILNVTKHKSNYDADLYNKSRINIDYLKKYSSLLLGFDIFSNSASAELAQMPQIQESLNKFTDSVTRKKFFEFIMQISNPVNLSQFNIKLTQDVLSLYSGLNIDTNFYASYFYRNVNSLTHLLLLDELGVIDLSFGQKIQTNGYNDSYIKSAQTFTSSDTGVSKINVYLKMWLMNNENYIYDLLKMPEVRTEYLKIADDLMELDKNIDVFWGDTSDLKTYALEFYLKKPAPGKYIDMLIDAPRSHGDLYLNICNAQINKLKLLYSGILGRAEMTEIYKNVTSRYLAGIRGSGALEEEARVLAKNNKKISQMIDLPNILINIGMPLNAVAEIEKDLLSVDAKKKPPVSNKKIKV